MFSVLEDQGFRSLMAHMDPRYTLPSRRFFLDLSLPEMYCHPTFSLLKADVTSIIFTTDIWSSDVSPMSMLRLTAQYIDPDF